MLHNCCYTHNFIFHNWKSMLTSKYAFYFQTSLPRDTRLHRVSPRRNFPCIAPSEGPRSMENFWGPPWTPFRHFPLSSATGFFLPSPMYLPSRFTSNASTYFTSRNLEKKSSLSRSAGCAPRFTMAAKKWIIPHSSFATALSNFYPFGFPRGTSWM